MYLKSDMKKNVPTLMGVKAHFKYYKMVELDISEVLEKKVVEYVYNYVTYLIMRLIFFFWYIQSWSMLLID